MTGYGRHDCSLAVATYLIEMKALNSRNLDLKLRLPAELLSHEPKLRKAISDIVVRGKVDCTITRTDARSEKPTVDFVQAEDYIKQLKQLAINTEVEFNALLPSFLQLPGLLGGSDFALEEDDIQTVQAACTETAQALMSMRLHEGQSLEKDLQSSVKMILKNLEQIEPLEERRITLVRERLFRKLDELQLSEKIDQNRFEQELVYSLDKLDINEEKVRLRQHCAFFVEVLSSAEINKGKRLNFISQEMGREINTLGSKANDSDIQRYVVDMKTQLEQIKEQVLNAL